MWLNDFEIVLEDRVIKQGAIRIESGVIAEISEGLVANADVEGGGRLLLPGFVDLHGDMIEKKLEPRPNVRMPMQLCVFDLDRELASCGITTAFAALSFQPATYGHMRSAENTIASINAISAMRHELLVDHRVHARFEVTFLSALETAEELMRSGALHLISLMDHTPGQGQYRNVEAHIANVATGNGVSTAEATRLVHERMSTRQESGDAMAVIVGLAKLACSYGVTIASHDDDSVEKVNLLHGLGAAISEFPITLEAALEARRLGLTTIMGAPNALRGLSYSGNLSARDAYQAGALDILVSDYHPSAMLPAIMALGEGASEQLARSVALGSSNPAKAVGLSDRGRIAKGLRADLVVAERGTVARMRATIRGGRPVWSDGTLGFPTCLSEPALEASVA